MKLNLLYEDTRGQQKIKLLKTVLEMGSSQWSAKDSKMIKANDAWIYLMGIDKDPLDPWPRIPEVEEAVKQDPLIAVLYAREVIGGRWSEAEEMIKQDPDSAVKYARDVIKGRWPEAEKVIKQDKNTWEEYQREILDQEVKQKTIDTIQNKRAQTRSTAQISLGRQYIQGSPNITL